jgi:hypothetical protein
MENNGLTSTCAVIDFVAIKLVGGEPGLDDFWNRWHDCFMRIRNPPNRDNYEHVFVDEMRKTRLMAQYIRDYDEMDWNDPNKTWQRLVKKGRASYDRARQHGNHIDTLRVLSGNSSAAAVRHESALPAIEDNRQQGNPNPGKGQSRASGNPSSSNAFFDSGQWSDSEPRPKTAPRPNVPHTAEQRKANGPCWFFAYGGCIMPNCKKEHRVMTKEEVAEIPGIWMTRRLAVIAPDAQGKSGSESDGSKGGRRDRPKCGGKDPKGGGKNAKGCKIHSRQSRSGHATFH